MDGSTPRNPAAPAWLHGLALSSALLAVAACLAGEEPATPTKDQAARIETWIAGLASKDEDTRADSADQLVKIGVSAALPLTRVLLDSDAPSRTRRLAAHTLERIRCDSPEVKEALIRASNAPDEQLRDAAVDALDALRPVDGTAPMFETLQWSGRGGEELDELAASKIAACGTKAVPFLVQQWYGSRTGAMQENARRILFRILNNEAAGTDMGFAGQAWDCFPATGPNKYNASKRESVWTSSMGEDGGQTIRLLGSAPSQGLLAVALSRHLLGGSTKDKTIVLHELGKLGGEARVVLPLLRSLKLYEDKPLAKAFDDAIAKLDPPGRL